MLPPLPSQGLPQLLRMPPAAARAFAHLPTLPSPSPSLLPTGSHSLPLQHRLRFASTRLWSLAQRRIVLFPFLSGRTSHWAASAPSPQRCADQRRPRRGPPQPPLTRLVVAPPPLHRSSLRRRCPKMSFFPILASHPPLRHRCTAQLLPFNSRCSRAPSTFPEGEAEEEEESTSSILICMPPLSCSSSSSSRGASPPRATSTSKPPLWRWRWLRQRIRTAPLFPHLFHLSLLLLRAVGTPQPLISPQKRRRRL